MKILTSFLFIITFLVSCGDQEQSNETFSSDQGLSQEHKKEFKKDLIEVTEDIYVGVGYGLANSIMIETENSLVIVDTLGSVERAEELYQDLEKFQKNQLQLLFTLIIIWIILVAQLFSIMKTKQKYMRKKI